MMLKEVCITPQLFEESVLINDSAIWKDVKHLLDSLAIGGYIIGLNNKDWIKAVYRTINQIENQKYKELFRKLIERLKDRNRIVGHPKSTIAPHTEDEWLTIAKEIDSVRSVDYIFATQQYCDSVTTPDMLEDMNIAETFGNAGTIHAIKSKKELERIFLPLLSYARKVTIIDPYFDLSTQRYKTTLELIAKCFKNKRGIRDKGEITIHCSSKVKVNRTKWKEVIGTIYQKYGHIINIKVWESQQDNIKMHDRYIITDQVGIISGAGTDKDDYQQSEWGIKEHETSYEILKQYNENFSSPFKLIEEVW